MPSNSDIFYSKILISGVVQSVGFRPFIKNLADKLGMGGYVRNMADAGVEVIISSNLETAAYFLREIKDNKPELSVIMKSSISKLDEKDVLEHIPDEFTILKSSNEKRTGGISPLPPDIACCSKCIGDLNTERRKNYGFISCTNCGPRFTAIRAIPYDRHNTAFDGFPLCDLCMQEYTTPKDRRYHAQTTCCNVCGPKFTLHLKQNNWKGQEFDIEKFVRLLEQGGLCTMMGTGGTHLVADALNHQRVMQLRKERRRMSDKPFAVMMRDIATIRNYCVLTPQDEKLLQSVRRPIVILPVRDRGLWTGISPGLGTLGVMLPYTSFHHLLFHNTSLDVLLMTSANQPQLPMPIVSEDILNDFMGLADAILVHNRPIIQRIDDSVIRSFGKEHRIIRRSRGFVPQPLYHADLKNLDAIAFGAEENSTAAIAKDGWIIPTQHIGHVINLENMNFMRDSIHHLLDLYSLDPKEFVADLHPSYLTTELASKFSLEYHGSFHQVQHHVAHVASLGIDKQIPHDEPLLAWACDGFGMSPDRKAWGCELILIDENQWTHAATTTPLGYSGGDQNAIYPVRMLLQYLKAGEIGISEDMKNYIVANLKNGDIEYNFTLNSKSDTMTTTSLARLLDSISALLQVSTLRSYRGEPAIKLEDIALQSSESYNPDVGDFIIRQNTMEMDTIAIFRDILEFHSRSQSRKNTARYTHDIIAKTMAIIGSEVANSNGVKHLGFTGGVAYNKILNNTIEQYLGNDIHLLTHENIPPGDAGIPAGQLNFLSMMLDDY